MHIKGAIMKYYIGIDGGGTKTKLIIVDEKLTKIYEKEGGASNFLMSGVEKVSEMLFDLIFSSLSGANIDLKDIASTLMGTTGAGRRSDAERLETGFYEFCRVKGVEYKKFYVESDARIALEGAFSGGPGAILIAGTGSIMFGKDSKGNIHRVGGFGRFIGDQGSGYMIGRKGLISITKYYDGRGIPTKLTSLVKEKYNISTPEELIVEIYRNNFDIASVAPLVMKAAEMEDEVCLEILEEEKDELIMHIVSMLEKLKEPIMKLCLIGGTIANDNIYSRMFKEEVEKKFKNVKIQTPDYEPAIGAAIMAINRIKN